VTVRMAHDNYHSPIVISRHLNNYHRNNTSNFTRTRANPTPLGTSSFQRANAPRGALGCKVFFLEARAFSNNQILRHP